MKTIYAPLSHEERRQYDYDLKKARDYHAELAHVRKEIFSLCRDMAYLEFTFATFNEKSRQFMIGEILLELI